MNKIKKRKGFTLIELMMVIAVIAILATMILIMLSSGRERAAVNKYIAYATQMYRLVADSVAAGYFDAGAMSITDGSSYCLGEYTSCGSATSIAGTPSGNAFAVKQALSHISDLPEKFEYSPYDTSNGVFMTVNNGKYIRVYMYLLSSDTTYLTKVCSSMNWATDANGYCYADISLTPRL